MLLIDCAHKWRLSNIFFVFMLIIFTGLDSANEIQKNFCFKERLVRMVSTKTQKKFLAAIYESAASFLVRFFLANTFELWYPNVLFTCNFRGFR